jgi:hypothetical protein
MESQSNGDKDQALKLFEAFLKDFPNSTLYADGTEAVQRIKDDLSTQPPVKAPAAPKTKSATPPDAAPPAAAVVPVSAPPAAK